MAVSKEKKGEILTKLKKIRKVLRERDIGYTIAKKTLTRKALSENNIAGNMPEMPGELGIVYGTDPLDSAREIYSFQKSLDKKVQIIGGIFEGKFMNREEMVSIAQIPGLKTLQVQFVNLINSPIQGFVMALSEIAKKKV